MAHYAEHLGVNLVHVVAYPVMMWKEVAFFRLVMDDVYAGNVGNLIYIQMVVGNWV